MSWEWSPQIADDEGRYSVCPLSCLWVEPWALKEAGERRAEQGGDTWLCLWIGCVLNCCHVSLCWPRRPHSPFWPGWGRWDKLLQDAWAPTKEEQRVPLTPSIRVYCAFLQASSPNPCVQRDTEDLISHIRPRHEYQRRGCIFGESSARREGSSQLLRMKSWGLSWRTGRWLCTLQSLSHSSSFLTTL